MTTQFFRRYCGVVLALTLWGMASASPASAQSASTPTPSGLPAQIKRFTVDTTVEASGASTSTSHMEITASNDAAAAQIATMPLIFREGTSAIDVVEAYTLKRDGRRLDVATSAIFTQMPPGAPSVPMFDDLRQKVIVFPDVKAGDTIVYTAKETISKPVLPGAFHVSYLFPRAISYQDVGITITVPAAMPLFADTVGPVPTHKTSNDSTIYTWRYAAPDTVPVEAKKHVFSFADVPHVIVSTVANYEEFARRYAGLVKDKTSVTPAIQAKADEIIGGVSDRRERAKRLYDWVSYNIRYVAILIGSNTIVPHDPEVTLKNGYGDCKDKAALLSALLKAVGIQSTPVLIGIGNSYELLPVPTFLQINHMIVWLPEFKLYADPTAGLTSFGVLPLPEYGKPVIHAVESGKVRATTPLVAEGAAVSQYKATVYMDWTGKIAGDLSASAYGPVTAELRAIAMLIQKAGPERIARIYLNSEKGLATFNFDSLDQFEGKYSLTARFEKDMDPGVLKSETFYLPHGMSLMTRPGDGLMGSLFQRAREDLQPRPCFSGQQTEELIFYPPPFTEIASVPPDVTSKTKNLEFHSHWQRVGRGITVMREFKSRINQSLCSGEVRREAERALDEIKKDYDAYHRITFKAVVPSVEELNDAVAANPFNPVVIATRASVYGLRKEYDKAIADLDEAIKLSPDYATAHLERGRAMSLRSPSDRGVIRAAVAEFDTAIRLNPRDAMGYKLRGIALNQLGETEKAMSDLKIAHDISPKDSQTSYLLASGDCARAGAITAGRVSKDSDCAKEMLSGLDRAIEIKPEPAAYLARAALAIKTGDFVAATADIEAAEKLGATARDIQKARAELLAERRDLPGALGILDTLVQENPRDAKVLRGRAKVNAILKKFDQAMTDIDAAVALDANGAETLGVRGWILVRRNKYTEAIADLDKALAIAPDQPFLFETRGVAYDGLKNPRKALEDYRKVLELAPQHPEIRTMIADDERMLKGAKP